jgi:hypothetical protein
MKIQKTSPESRKNNPVARHAIKFNRSSQFLDRKKAEKRGYRRCKDSARYLQDDSKPVFNETCLLSS